MAQKKFKGLPLYAAELLNEDCGVLRVSLVDAPAVESDFLSYSAEQRQDYAIADEDKRRVFGCVLRADYPIYRRDHGHEYFITFAADQIRAFAQKYLAEGRQNEIDLHHDLKSIEGAEMVQYFIKDTEAGIAPVGFDDIADGSLFCEYQITDETLWQRIKEGEFKGFSVEIVHAQTPVEYNTQKTNMNTLFERIKTALADGLAAVESELAAEQQAAAQYKSVATDNGVLVWDTDEDLKAGDKVYIEDAEGNRVAAADGDYKTEDGKTIVVAEGVVSEIKDVEAEVAPENEPEEAAAEEAEKEPEAEPAAEEEKPAEEEAPTAEDEKDVRIAELENKLAEAEARIAELEAALAEAEAKLKEPQGMSAHEAYQQQKNAPKVEDNFAEMMKRIR